MDTTGIELSRAYHADVVAPLVAQRWPDLPYAAGRLGPGSDVLGFDDVTSRDHDWGLRLTLLVPDVVVAALDGHLAQALPPTFSGLPTRFPVTGDPEARHRVEVTTVEAFVRSRTGWDGARPPTVGEWLSLTGQSVLEVAAGPVYVDTDGALTRAREVLEWYPDDVWRYVVATDWARLAQELPFVGRTGDRGDDAGSRIIAARLASIVLHLAHVLDRRWPPYPKWLGTSARGLPRSSGVVDPLSQALTAASWQAREAGLVEALGVLHRAQAQAGLPVAGDAVGPFWDRPYRAVRDEMVLLLEESVTDPEVRALPRGVGSAEQWSHNVDVLVDTSRRLRVC